PVTFTFNLVNGLAEVPGTLPPVYEPVSIDYMSIFEQESSQSASAPPILLSVTLNGVPLTPTPYATMDGNPIVGVGQYSMVNPGVGPDGNVDFNIDFFFNAAASGTLVISYSLQPTYQVVANCLGTCTEEYTLPDDNPVIVVNNALYAGDAGVTLNGVPLTPIPYAQPNPIYPPVVGQGQYTASSGSYWFSPLDVGDLFITYYCALPAGATISPSGNVWVSDAGATYDDGT